MVPTYRTYARTAGALYLAIFVAALFGEVFVSGALVVDGDAIATAGKIVGSEQLWRLGIGAQAITLVCDVAVAWLLYVLLKPAGKDLALLAAFFRLTYVAVYAPAVVANAAALRLAKAHVSQAATYALHAHDAAFTLSLIFFGIHLALVGYLIARPPIGVQWLAIALEVTGVCYVVNSFLVFVAPSVSAVLFPWILLPPFVGELGLTFWLLFTRRFSEAT